MSKNRVKQKTQFPTEKLGGWDALIAESQQRIQDLQFSIRVFERKKAAGEQCPMASPQSDTELIQRAIA
jgi:hypothetical protein